MFKPNILIVLSDQLTRRALGCYGDSNGATPNIDQLAHEGVQFNAACSTYPVCVPFRFTMLTGHCAHSRRVPAIDWRMSPTERTLADEFNDGGYHSAYIGKWHLWGGHSTWAMKRPVPRQHRGNWDKWLGFEFRNDFYDSVYFEDDDPAPREIDGYQTDGLFDAAIAHLTGRQDDKPFCAILSVEAPHPPMQAPETLKNKWLDTNLDLPPNFMIAPDDLHVAGKQYSPGQYDVVLLRRKIYYAMVENLDQNMAKLRTALQQSDLDQNTIVVFLADHGDMGGCHSMHDKQSPYEESVGIPLIVWGPNCGVAAGGTIDQPVCCEDLFPTICGLADLPQRSDLVGTNLAPLIYGNQNKIDRSGVMLEFVRELRPNMPFFGTPWRGFRSQRYKYTVLHKEDHGLLPWQFFDLQEDRYELNNLINNDASQQTIAEHHKHLRDRMIETGDDEWLAQAYGYSGINTWALCEIKG